MTTIALLPGDGIGCEVLDGPVELLRVLNKAGLAVDTIGPLPYGSSGWAGTGSVLPDETVDACRAADVILSGAVGTHPGVAAGDCPQPERALIELRHMFDLRVSVRTVWVPLRGDVVVVRNMTGGAYANVDQRTESDGCNPAEDRIVLEPERIRELFAIAIELAEAQPERPMVSVDKASTFATSRLWRRIADEVSAKGAHRFRNVNVDRAAYEFVKLAELPGIVVTEGIFGDILSDVLCARAGSPAMCGSATVRPGALNSMGPSGLFEPAHGSSPHRTGSRTSNPTGAWLALAALFDWCGDLKETGVSRAIRSALDVARVEAPTYDIIPDGRTPSSLDDFNNIVMSNSVATLESS